MFPIIPIVATTTVSAITMAVVFKSTDIVTSNTVRALQSLREKRDKLRSSERRAAWRRRFSPPSHKELMVDKMSSSI